MILRWKNGLVHFKVVNIYLFYLGSFLREIDTLSCCKNLNIRKNVVRMHIRCSAHAQNDAVRRNVVCINRRKKSSNACNNIHKCDNRLYRPDQITVHLDNKIWLDYYRVKRYQYPVKQCCNIGKLKQPNHT